MSAERLIAQLDRALLVEEIAAPREVQRPIKVVFLGAGSGFFMSLFPDILHIPGANRGEFALVDIDPERLELAVDLGQMINKERGAQWTITGTADRRQALKGADYIINCIEVSGVDCVRFDNDIPKKYGVDQCIGDTVGPGGLFKALRTVPVWLDVLKDIEELCPKAWVLNYTNPMSIMTLAAHRTSSARVLGLCHSVQGTSHGLSRVVEVSYAEMKWTCAGINHLAWFTELSHQGRDLYPVLREKALKDPNTLASDPVRFDMMLHFGYFVTESSGHFSEYLPYYRKRPELIEKHCGPGYRGGSGFYAREWPGWRKDYDQVKRMRLNGEYKPAKQGRTWEYASHIIEALETSYPFVAYCSVPNTGLISNLPGNGVVEVGCTVTRDHVAPQYFGELPPQCAALCAANMHMFDLAATACIERSKELAVQALLLDPLTAAVCSPGEIRQMTEELFEAEKGFLEEYK